MTKRQDDWRDLDWSVSARGDGKTFHGTAGDDDLHGTKFKDVFHMEQGGVDHVEAGKGQDIIYMGASLTGDDRIDGGAAYDILVLKGDYSSGLDLQPDTISRVEELDLRGHFNYSITLPADMIEDRTIIGIDATRAHSLHFDGSAVDFGLGIGGSGADDVIAGSNQHDLIFGGAGADVLTSGGGQDLFEYASASDSRPLHPDVITDFDNDVLDLSQIDGDTKMPGRQPLHFGATAGHTGDITVTYDSAHDVTMVNVFTDKDARPDMVIQLTGDHTDLTAANFSL